MNEQSKTAIEEGRKLHGLAQHEGFPVLRQEIEDMMALHLGFFTNLHASGDQLLSNHGAYRALLHIRNFIEDKITNGINELNQWRKEQSDLQTTQEGSAK